MASRPSWEGPNGEALAGAPFPQWTIVYGGFGCVTGSLRVAEVTNATEKALAESVAFPCQVHFFVSQAAAQAAANKRGGSGSIPGVNQALDAGNQALNVGTSAAQCVGGLLIMNGKYCINLEQWMLRIGEVLLGLVLVGVGLARITGVDNAISKVLQTKMPIPV